MRGPRCSGLAAEWRAPGADDGWRSGRRDASRQWATPPTGQGVPPATRDWSAWGAKAADGGPKASWQNKGWDQWAAKGAWDDGQRWRQSDGLTLPPYLPAPAPLPMTAKAHTPAPPYTRAAAQPAAATDQRQRDELNATDDGAPQTVAASEAPEASESPAASEAPEAPEAPDWPMEAAETEAELEPLEPPAAAPTPPRRRVWFSGARRGTAAKSSGSGAAAGARGNDVVTEPPVGDDGAAAGAEGNDAVMEPPDVVEIVDEGGAVVEEVAVECIEGSDAKGGAVLEEVVVEISEASAAEGGGSDEEDDARQRTGGRRDARRRTGDVTIVGKNRRRVGPRGLPHFGVCLHRWDRERQGE